MRRPRGVVCRARRRPCAAGAAEPGEPASAAVAAPTDASAEESTETLAARLKALQQDREALAKSRDRAEAQRALLERHADAALAPKPGAKGAAAPALDIEAVWAFTEQLAARTEELDDRLAQLRKDCDALDAKIADLRAVIRGRGAPPAGEKRRRVSVLVEVTGAGEVELLVSYVVRKAAWKPAYDVRVSTDDRQLQLVYYGEVRQSTGEDWTDAEVSLSTAQPGKSVQGGGAARARCGRTHTCNS